MMNNPKIAFVINENDHSIAIQTDLEANLATVWNTWTKAEYLDRWWAPKPYVTLTKAQYFRTGGIWLYAMAGPNGDKHFCKAQYGEIVPQQSFSFKDAFCTEDGKTLIDKPSASWIISFLSHHDVTTVTINIAHETGADLEKILNMGFKEGFAMAIDNLSQLLKFLNK